MRGGSFAGCRALSQSSRIVAIGVARRRPGRLGSRRPGCASTLHRAPCAHGRRRHAIHRWFLHPVRRVYTGAERARRRLPASLSFSLSLYCRRERCVGRRDAPTTVSGIARETKKKKRDAYFGLYGKERTRVREQSSSRIVSRLYRSARDQWQRRLRSHWIITGARARLPDTRHSVGALSPARTYVGRGEERERESECVVSLVGAHTEER